MKKRFSRAATHSIDLDITLLPLTAAKHPEDRITLRDVMEHILIFGASGSGKTSTVDYALVKAIMRAPERAIGARIGMVVFLYKAADIDDWFRWAEECGRTGDVVVIGPQDRDVLNLLALYSDKEPAEAVETLMILSGLSVGGGSDSRMEPSWEQLNRQRLHRLILLNQHCGEALNIATLHRLHSMAPRTPEQIQSTELRQANYCCQMIDRAYRKLGEHHPDFQLIEDYFARVMPYMADRTQSSILSLTDSVLEPFASSALLRRLFCGDTTVSLDTMLSGKIVIFNLPIQQYGHVGKIAQMMLKHVLCKQIEARDLTTIPNPVILHIDEYQHFISPYDALFLSTARSSRAGFIGLTQNVSGLYAQIGGNGKVADEKVNSLLSLTNHKFFLAQNNYITNEFAARTIGQNIRQLANSSVQMDQFAGSAGISESFQYQVMPREFTMLRRGGSAHHGIVEAIVTATGKTFSNGCNYLRTAFKQPWM